mmetsp:Transcript_97372/g.275263  ORF Transcript_97372/g.275263 Transcript_97372/m.275263 type:complete len:340 (+) Transcript_97372:142-1161(+)
MGSTPQFADFALERGFGGGTQVDAIEPTQYFVRFIMRIRKLLELAAELELGFVLVVLLAHRLRLLHHPGDLCCVQPPASVVDRAVRLRLRLFILGGYAQHAIRIEGERNLDLRFALFRPLDPCDFELAKQAVAVNAWSLPLVNADVDLLLVVLYRRVSAGLLAGDGAVAGNDDREDLTLCFDAKGQRRDVDQEHLRCVRCTHAGKDRALHSCAVGDCLVRVNRLAQFFATEKAPERLLDERHTSRPTNEHDVIDVLRFQLRVFQDAIDGVKATIKQRRAQLLKLTPCTIQHTLGVGNQVGNIDLHRLLCGKVALRHLRRAFYLCLEFGVDGVPPLFQIR